MMKIGFWQPPRLQQLSLLAYSIDGRLPSVVFFSTTIHSQFQNEPQNCLGHGGDAGGALFTGVFLDKLCWLVSSERCRTQ
jgi:hypothetical protein